MNEKKKVDNDCHDVDISVFMCVAAPRVPMYTRARARRGIRLSTALCWAMAIVPLGPLSLNPALSVASMNDFVFRTSGHSSLRAASIGSVQDAPIFYDHKYRTVTLTD